MRILDRKRVVSNMWIATTYISGRECTATDLKASFNDAISASLMTRLRTERGGVCIDFDNSDIVKLLVKNGLLTRDFVAAGNHVISPSKQGLYRDKIRAALDLIRELDPQLHSLICALIATVACYRIPDTEGGSVSSCIGLIYLSPNPVWSSEFCGELLVHEFIHNSLFLEDMVRGVFPDYDLFDDEDALVTSTLRQTKRPFDKSYHSACVAVGLMYFHHLLGTAGKERDLIPRLQKTVQELEACDRNLSRGGKLIITPNGRQLLEEIRRFVVTLDYGIVAKALQQ